MNKNNLKQNLNICPICNIRECYYKTQMVKNGYTIKNPNGTYYFKQTGWIEKIDEWWSCKKCAKDLSAKEYNNKLVKIFS